MRKLTLLLLTTFTLMAFADDYRYLTAVYDDVEQSFKLATVQKITFEQGNVVIATSQGTTSIPQASMQKMFFDAQPTAVEALPEASQSLTLNGTTLSATGQGLLCVYNTAGQLVSIAQVDGQASLSLASLPKGVYIISLAGETIKVSKP